MKIVEGDKATAFPLLAKVIERGKYNWPEICRKVDAHHYQLWIVQDPKPVAALMTAATVDDSLECILAGGVTARKWALLAESELTKFAIEHDLKRLRIWGRKGWIRYFPHWQKTDTEDGFVILEKIVY